VHSKVVILREGLKVRMSLIATSQQVNVPKQTLATEMEVDPWGVLEPLDSIELIVMHSTKL
jgi:predicted regulator of amino acid metabolism with ACT domain